MLGVWIDPVLAQVMMTLRLLAIISSKIDQWKQQMVVVTKHDSSRWCSHVFYITADAERLTGNITGAGRAQEQDHFSNVVRSHCAT